jgi:RimJ/RimL family protein N-acetyltransferase
VPDLEDGSIRLREWIERDLSAVVAAVEDLAIARWSHLPDPFDREAVDRWWRDMPSERAAGTAVRLCIADRASDRPVGAIALQNIDLTLTRRAELGYWVAAHARGRGVAQRAIGVICDWGLGALGLMVIGAVVDRDNPASCRLLEGLGFYRRSLQTSADAWLYQADLSRRQGHSTSRRSITG